MRSPLGKFSRYIHAWEEIATANSDQPRVAIQSKGLNYLRSGQRTRSVWKDARGDTLPASKPVIYHENRANERETH